MRFAVWIFERLSLRANDQLLQGIALSGSALTNDFVYRGGLAILTGSSKQVSEGELCAAHAANRAFSWLMTPRLVDAVPCAITDNVSVELIRNCPVRYEALGPRRGVKLGSRTPLPIERPGWFGLLTPRDSDASGSKGTANLLGFADPMLTEQLEQDLQPRATLELPTARIQLL
jgi:hypothetical protein